MSEPGLIDLLSLMAQERGSKLEFRPHVSYVCAQPVKVPDRANIWVGDRFLGAIGLIDMEWMLIVPGTWKKTKIHPASPSFFDELSDLVTNEP